VFAYIMCVVCSVSFAVHRVMLLEFSQYLENYLWPNYSTDATDAHVLSVVVMVNEKFRERVPAWEVCMCVCVGCLTWTVCFTSNGAVTHEQCNNNRFPFLCPGLPGSASTRRNIHPLTPL